MLRISRRMEPWSKATHSSFSASARVGTVFGPKHDSRAYTTNVQLNCNSGDRAGHSTTFIPTQIAQLSQADSYLGLYLRQRFGHIIQLNSSSLSYKFTEIHFKKLNIVIQPSWQVSRSVSGTRGTHYC